MPSTSMKRHWRLAPLLLSFAIWLAPVAQAAPAPAEKNDEVRLYALDCGRIGVRDFGAFVDTGESDGKPRTLSDPCFVIRHPKGILLWDSGLSDKFADTQGGVDMLGGAFHLSVATKLVDQLKAIGLTPADVNYVAFSHLHFDHTGNANLFGSASFIMNSKEVAWANATPTPFGVDPTAFSAYASAKKQPIDGDYDVFGDGSVRILKAPGHTPGHQVLEVKLKKAGVMVLAGDLYHARENRQFRRVPTFNDSRADTLASIDRIETLVKSLHARLIVQHELTDFESLPKFPQFLN